MSWGTQYDRKPILSYLIKLVKSGLASLASCLSREKRLTIVIDVKLSDHDVGCSDSDRGAGSVRLLPSDAFDVDAELLTVALGDLAFTALESTTNDLNLVILTDGHRLHVVLCSEFLTEGS